ncbi:hypothetical protein J6590_068749 [Homalodisca vitripennis]|nr:hypothetical protein J6590_068749 [Homalodisca vitripennis]
MANKSHEALILGWIDEVEESELDNCDSMNESDAQTEYSDHNTNTDQSDCEIVLRQEDTVQKEIKHSQAATAPLASTSNIQYVQGKWERRDSAPSRLIVRAKR